MKREIIETADGSKTIFIPEWNEHYHSKHGAIQEAKHVFIKHGLHYRFDSNSKTTSKSQHVTAISILEMGFGTGLNAFLTALQAHKGGFLAKYTGIEAFPVKKQELELLNFSVSQEEQELFNKIHSSKWEKEEKISDKFCLLKLKKDFLEVDEEAEYDLIYFDAFGIRVQPELWTEDIFCRMYRALKVNGVLVTYAAAGSVRRAMQAVGFSVEKLPGPPGKREMLRAIKKA